MWSFADAPPQVKTVRLESAKRTKGAEYSPICRGMMHHALTETGRFNVWRYHCTPFYLYTLIHQTA